VQWISYVSYSALQEGVKVWQAKENRKFPCPRETKLKSFLSGKKDLIGVAKIQQ